MFGNVNVDYKPCKTVAQLQRACKYILGRNPDQIKSGAVKTRPDLYYAFDDDRDNFADEVLLTRRMHGKKVGGNLNLAYKMSISFHPDEKLTYEEAFQIAKEFADRYFHSRDAGTDPSDFRKLSFTDVRVIDAQHNDVAEGEVGELCVYTDGVITDYFGNPELSAEKILKDDQGRRWFCTGDLVNKLPNGIVRFAGRSKRIIKRGGNLVHAEEVEACLLTHPKIAAAAVTDEPHPVIGQQIVAYIQPKGDERVTRGELARYFDGKLSAYKVPDKVVLVEEIPKDIGKIQFKYLRKKEYK